MGKKRTALLIDGGHLRAVAKKARIQYEPDFIETFAHSCIDAGDELLRILYYDAPQYNGTQKRPVSGNIHEFRASNHWLTDLASRDLFAVRQGTLAFRGWTPKRIPISGRELTDDDFKPNFEQKGVDMRVGIDIATLADKQIVEQIVLVSADFDMIPALKHARKSGLLIVSVQLPTPPAIPLDQRFLAHCDFRRPVTFSQSEAAGGPPIE